MVLSSFIINFTSQVSVDIAHSFVSQTSIDYIGSVGEGWVTKRGKGRTRVPESGYIWAKCLGKVLNICST